MGAIKILLTQNSPFVPSLTGAAHSNRIIMQELSLRGYACEVVCPSGHHENYRAFSQMLATEGRGEKKVLEECATHTVSKVGNVLVHSIHQLSTLRQYLQQRIEQWNPFRVIVSSEDPGQVLLAAALTTASDRVVYFAHTTSMLPFGPESALPSMANGKLLQRVCRIAALSQYLADYIEHWGHISALALPLSLFGRGPFPAYNNFPKGTITMVNPCLEKGITLFVELAKEFPSLSFTAVSSWGTTEQDRQLLNGLSNVNLEPYSDDIETVFSRTKVLLVPSLWAEARARVVVEAMLRGIPVLASNVGGIPEAMLGLDYLLPVNAISIYEQRIVGEQLLRQPVIPQQNLDPWRRALTEITGSAECYTNLSRAARHAAGAYIEKNGIEAIESFLLASSDRPTQLSTTAVTSTTSSLSQKIKSFPQETQALIVQRLARSALRPKAKEPTSEHTPRSGRYPLSAAQEGLWLFHEMNPGSAVFNLPGAFKLEGPVDPDALRQAFEEMHRRHTVFRTLFQNVSGRPEQVIGSDTCIDHEVLDLSAASEAAAWNQVKSIVESDLQTPFSLGKAPLQRSRLLKLNKSCFVLTLTTHHIIMDGWSTGIYMNELSQLYRSYVTRTPHSLHKVRCQYVDYVLSLSDLLQGEHLERLMTYWRNQLTGPLPQLELPNDRVRPLTQTFGGAVELFSFDRSFCQRLRELGRETGATLFITLLAGFKLLLFRYCRQDDIIVGTPVAGRGQMQWEAVIGLFVNTLPIRTKLASKGSFKDLVRVVKQTFFGALAHQDLPFEKMVEMNVGERDISRSPLFQVMFALQNSTKATLELSGVAVTPLVGDSGTVKCDLDVTILENSTDLTGTFAFNTDLFERQTIKRMIAHWQTLFEAALADPDAPILGLPMLSAEEFQTVTTRWNATDFPHRDRRNVHQQFEDVAKKYPDRVALIGEKGSLTFREVNTQANRIAYDLLNRGVCKSRVGFCMYRSTEAIVSMLAILKTGSAFVPIDPTFPQERKNLLLRSSGTGVILTNQADLRVNDQAVILTVNPDVWERDSPQDPLDSGISISCQELAWILYTSGSTAQPKGVAGSHLGILNRCLFLWETSPFADNEIGFQNTTFTVVDSLWEIWAPLLAGHALVLLDEEKAKDPCVLIETLRRHAIRRICLVPSLLNVLLGLYPNLQERVPALKTWVVSGETLSAELCLRFHRLMPGCTLYNQYGLTETTADVTSFCTNTLLHGTEVPTASKMPSVPIGKPIFNMKAFILDATGWPVPIGVVGEIHFSGDSLALEYIDSADLNRHHFVESSFEIEGRKQRLYRTGDFGRYLPDSNIEYLGRIDAQTKIRGFRVAPGEVESALRSHPHVKEAAVVAVKNLRNENALVAFVASEQPGDVAEELRSFLTSKVPQYLIPEKFVRIDEFPRTNSGKISYGNLAALRIFVPGLPALRDLPRNTVEEQVLRLWQFVLLRRDLGIYDNFFACGGHSLLASILLAKLRQHFGDDIPLRFLFENPTISAQATLLSDRSKKGVEIPRVEKSDHVLCSFSQRRLFLACELASNKSVYTIQIQLKLSGTLDVKALSQSLNAVIQRHEALRTIFAIRDGEPCQIIQPFAERPFDCLDLSTVAGHTQEAELATIFQEEAGKTADIKKGPLFSSRLVKLSDLEHVLTMSLHHMIADGWSMGILVREIVLHYQLFTNQTQAKPAPLSIQYRDYAAWQRTRFLSLENNPLVEHWKSHRSREVTPIVLPSDRPRPQSKSYSGRTLTDQLPASCLAQIDAMKASEGITAFTILYSAFSAFLYRYTCQREILIPSPVANRVHFQTTELIGFFINIVLLKSQFPPGISFREHIANTRTVVLCALENQEIPFESLMNHLSWTRGAGQDRLFPVAFVLQNLPQQTVELAGLQIKNLPVESTSAKYDLTLTVVEGDGGFEFLWEYDTDLFDEERIRRMMLHFQTFLRNALCRAHAPIDDIEMLEQNEIAALDRWNYSAQTWDTTNLVSVIDRLAVKNPDAHAIVSGNLRLSYAELRDQVDRIATHLRQASIGTEDRVAVFARRSPELISSMLAILKLGACYVPLSDSLPRERVAYILHDANVRLLIVAREFLPYAPAGEHAIRCIDELLSVDTTASSAAPAESPSDAAAAAILYTSGSTGAPKGVFVTYEGLNNALRWSQAHLGFDWHDKGLLKSDVGFDVSLWESLLPLISGGTVIIPVGPNAHDARTLAETVNQHQVSVIHFVPSLLKDFLQQSSPEDGSSLRLIVSGGESLTPELLTRAREKWPVKIYNLYGPTESSILVTHFECESDRSIRRVPIGQPISNTKIFVLDSNLNRLPLNTPGQIYIQGIPLSRGYAGRPDWTAEAFVPDPCSGAVGSRLYKTGDLGCVRPDGTIDFLGRIDSQIKFRGVRIEPAELEQALRKHSDVADALVMVSPASQSALIAYVVPAENREFREQHLREYLQRIFPPYMIPSRFVAVEEFPVGKTGKLNIAALPEVQIDGSGTPNGFLPEHPFEVLLKHLWQKILGVTSVTEDANFFELGGDSLTGMQMLARIGEAVQADLPLRMLFEAPTLRALAREIRTLASSLVSVSGGTHESSRFQTGSLSFAQRRLWFLYEVDPHNAAYNIAAAVRLRGSLIPSICRQVIDQLVAKHEALRTGFLSFDGNPLQYTLQRASSGFEVVDLEHLPADKRENAARQLATAEASTSFTLELGSLFRARLFKLNPHDYVLLFVIHHIVSDGWSMGILIREFSSLYSQMAKNVPGQSIGAGRSYLDYVRWQKEKLSPELLSKQKRYWLGQLAEPPPVCSFPTDFPRPPINKFDGATLSFQVPTSLHRALIRYAQQEKATLFMVLLGAFQLLLGRYSGQSDLVIGIPLAGRKSQEDENTVGFFANTLVLRSKIDLQSSFSELLFRVKQTTLDAFENQDYPFEFLVEDLRQERDPSRNPLFEVMFVLQNTPRGVLDLQGLTMEPFPVQVNFSKFDVTLSVAETQTGLDAAIEYKSHLFSAETVQRIADSYAILLQNIISEPRKSIGELGILSASDRATLLRQSVDQLKPLPAATVSGLFEAQVTQNPDKLALLCGGRTWNYASLNSLANQLAWHLSTRVTELEPRVAILLPRTADLITSILACLKVGAAYIPLDTNLPPQRLNYILRDSRAVWVITQEALRGRLDFPEDRCTLVDSERELISAHSVRDLGRPVPPEQLCYIIYTSGSTGSPKAIAVEQRNLLALVAWGRQFFPRNELELVLAASSISFDASVFEIVGTLCLGGAIFLVENIMSLATMSQISGITMVSTVPSALSEVLHTVGLPGSVQAVVCAAEPFSETLVRAVSEQPGIKHVYDLYGPTECTVYSTAAVRFPDQKAHIGKPIQNTFTYVLDGNLQLVPTGVPGELHIGGAGVARGYVTMPDVTAEKFIPDPYASIPGSRLYKTGDVVRHNPQGELEYLGRRDNQVKLRGFRIELEEIEALLETHPQVAEASVILDKDRDALVAFVMLKPQAEMEEVRAFVQQRVPAYMVPSRFLSVRSLPRTPSGKIDRRSLGKQIVAAPGDEDIVLPRSRREWAILHIWQKILQRTDFGVTQNFFRIGGNSLLSVRLIAEIEKQIGVRVPLSVVFKFPTVEGFSTEIVSKKIQEESLLVPILTPDGAAKTLFMVHPTGGTVFCYGELAQHLAPGIAVFGIQASGVFSDETHSEIEVMAKAYIDEIRRIQPQGPYLIGGWSMGGFIAFEMACQLRAANERLDLLLVIDSGLSDANATETASVARFDPQLILERISFVFGRRIEISPEEISNLGKEEFLELLLVRAKELKLLPLDTSDQYLRRILNVVEQNNVAISHFAPKPCDAAMTFVKATDRLTARRQPIEADWLAYAKGGMEIIQVEGNHFSMMRAPRVKGIADIINIKVRGSLL